MGSHPAYQIGVAHKPECTMNEETERNMDFDIILDEEEGKSESSDELLTLRPLFAKAPWRDPVAQDV